MRRALSGFRRTALRKARLLAFRPQRLPGSARSGRGSLSPTKPGKAARRSSQRRAKARMSPRKSRPPRKREYPLPLHRRRAHEDEEPARRGMSRLNDAPFHPAPGFHILLLSAGSPLRQTAGSKDKTAGDGKPLRCQCPTELQETLVSCPGDLGLLKLAQTNDASAPDIRRGIPPRQGQPPLAQPIRGRNTDAGASRNRGAFACSGKQTFSFARGTHCRKAP